MPDRQLADAYLERLAASLALPEVERSAVIEEIASHVELAAAELVERGMPGEDAVRRILARFGAPEVLARDLNAAHREPGHLLEAAGVAVRISLVSGFRAFVLAWLAMFLLAIGAALAVAGLRQVLGMSVLERDWSPILDGLLPAVVAAVVAFAVGRTVVRPVALAARRDPAEIRLPLLVIGTVATATVALAAVGARWQLPSALLMATAPAWFALGILRPTTFPRVQVPRAAMTLSLIGLVILAPLLFIGLGETAVETFEGSAREWDPAAEYAAIGSFVDIESPPLVLDETPFTSSAGPGPVRIEREGRFTVPPTWTDVRLEVWAGATNGELSGPIIDQGITEPLATAPMEIHGRYASGHVDLSPLPDRQFYAVAITGIDEQGQRVQLAWPGHEHWMWRGTVAQYLLAGWR